MKKLSDKLTSVKSKLTDSFKDIKKNIGKYAIASTLLLGGALYSNSAKAQDYEYKKSWPIMDFYSQLNIVQGKEKGILEYYGSGDVNKDGKVTIEDAQQIYMGVSNEMADVDGNGIVNSTDAQIIEDYVNGTRNHLPGDWNKLSAQEKEDWMNKRIPFYLEYMSRTVDCDINSNIYFFNFTGIENFENYEGWDEDDDGIKEGYNYYKNKIKFGNGFENIPLYESSVKTQEGTPHKIYCYLGGKEGEETNPLNFNHWNFFDYLTGKEISPGDPFMNKDEYAIIQGMKVWNEQTQKHESVQLVHFDLNNGEASIEDLATVNPFMLFQNPHTAKVKLNQKGDVQVEANGQPNISEGAVGKPSLETNLKEHYAGIGVRYNPPRPAVDYTPTLSFTDSEFTPFDPELPHYGELTRKYIASSTMGRWNPTNKPNLADTTEFKIIVDDTVAPNITLSSNSVEGEVNSNPEELAKSLINSITDASTSYGYKVETLLTGTQNPSFEDDNFYYYDVELSAKDVRGNKSSPQAAQVKVKKLSSGLEELITQQKDIDIDIYPNPVNENTTLRVTSKNYLKEGKILIHNSLGQPIDIIEVNDLLPSSEKEINYSGFGSAKSGTYIVNFIGNNSKDTEKVLKK